ncbi:coronin-7 isoform X2 [Cylas formicarius]|uniref:coronin-7 isoform X2 n=1 Tax=Cylas formicarius TaxID=197179 RepID=UPI0029583CF4|nr:coronin-7 isoform X2 [Cylas formicarius]
MAWRFKASKYKNATPIVPKPETYVRDISVGSYQTYGNNIKASAKFMAFNWDHVGSSLAVLPLDDCGRKGKLMPLLHAHSDTVTDMDFSPFDDGMLATGSQDCLVKIWHIPSEGLTESVSNAQCIFSHKQRRVETVGFHPTADFLLHSSSFTTLTLWDLISETESFSNSDHDEVIQSVSWKQDGTLLGTSCKDKQVRIFDPRANVPCVKQADGHQSIKDSRLVWLGNQDRILTSGFNAQRLRQILIRDLRNFKEPEKVLELDCSTGILMPLYDADTGMLFLAGKGDNTIGYMEVTDKEPFLVEGIRHSGEQTKGACLVPKRALNVMQGEVNRILQLTSSSVIPVTYQVPRKTYRDFHVDLFPETPGFRTELIASEWLAGVNMPLPKISLDPAKRIKGGEPLTVHRGPLAELKELYKNRANKEPAVEKVNPSAVQEERHPIRNIVKTLEKDSEPKNSIIRKEEIANVDVARPIVEENHKPRLGPKPFTPPKLNDTENSFSKIFSVPGVPSGPIVPPNGVIETKEEEEEIPIFKKVDSSDGADACKIDKDNSLSTFASAEDEINVDSGYVPKTPSTAERRKLFEVRSSSKENDEDSDSFDRGSTQRSSIAERRKLYEHSPQPQQEPITEKGTSPVMLRTKETLKNQKNIEEASKEGGKRKSASFTKQQSLDQGVKRQEPAPTTKRTSTVFGRVSKFRHLKGTAAHKSFHIENIRNLSRQIPGECDGFHANPERVAVPLSGAGGKIAIFELSKTGKIPDGVIPALVHGNNVMDFCWDPFDGRRLAVACDDGVIKLWTVPENGLTVPTNQPDTEFVAHSDKIYFIKFHPTASNVLASGSYDLTIKIWDLANRTNKITLTGHAEHIFCFCWSSGGDRCATVSKDGKVRIFDPRRGGAAIREGKGPEGSRGARAVWALDDRFLVVTGFDKVSERQITVYKVSDLSPVNTIGLDVSPAILIPFYDEDSSTLFVTGRGDMTIYTFEITDEAPFVCPLSHHKCNSLHQGLSFLSKNVCDVANVEFAKALRLTNNSIEPLSFTVPRIRTELFQDDLFPPTRVAWEPLYTGDEWFDGTEKPARRISLKPDDMDCMSESQNHTKQERTINKSQSTPFISSAQPHNRLGWNAELSSQVKNKQEEIQKSVSDRLEINLKLEQDDMEGVDEKEWLD